jgi:hypothetical protein
MYDIIFLYEKKMKISTNIKFAIVSFHLVKKNDN